MAGGWLSPGVKDYANFVWNAVENEALLEHTFYNSIKYRFPSLFQDIILDSEEAI